MQTGFAVAQNEFYGSLNLGVPLDMAELDRAPNDLPARMLPTIRQCRKALLSERWRRSLSARLQFTCLRTHQTIHRSWHRAMFRGSASCARRSPNCSRSGLQLAYDRVPSAFTR